MRVDVIVVGKIKPGPEKDLFAVFSERFNTQGRNQSLGPLRLIEIEEKRPLARDELALREGEKIISHLPQGAKLISLDERGKSLESKQFAAKLGAWRDEGIQTTAFVIGGAGGLSQPVRDRADLSISFGKLTWPHMLARAMLAEQLFRATTILSGHPYHREG
jgi:23S rRNA (pseudouridine1915-N3)-methyltransferase